MRCEVCGREIRGPPLRRIIEGGRLTVCSQCARFGDEEWTPTPPKPPQKGRGSAGDLSKIEDITLVEDYGMRIKEARERMNMTVEELARRIGEKESVIKKLEKEELVPNEALVQKLRRTLKVELLVPEERGFKISSSKPVEGRRLGDLLKLKEEKEAAEEDEEKQG
ncbi:MAG: multiprotein bridging factor aMBF1 [Candidatus Bathyarchaeia archaeon]